MPKVTVAIPTYNRANYLKEAMESVLAQTFQDFELLILDNHSSDNTYEVVASFHDKRIRYVRNSRNIGARKNVNKPFSMALGDNLVILGDDDCIKPTFLERAIHILDSYPDIAVVSANAGEMNAEGEITSERILPVDEDRIFGQYAYIEALLSEYLLMPLLTSVFRMDVVRKYRMRFRRAVGYADDYFLFSEFNLHNGIYLMADTLGYIRFHSQQNSRRLDKFYQQLTLFQTTLYKIIVDNKLESLMPGIRYQLSCTALDRLISEHPFQHTFNHEIEELRQEDFWIEDHEVAVKVKLFLLLNNAHHRIRSDNRVRPMLDDKYNPSECYKVWLDNLMAKKEGISSVLYRHGIRKAVVYGTKFTAYLLMMDLRRENIDISCFVDSNINRHGQKLGGIPIVSPQWLLENKSSFHVIITSIEGAHDEGIKTQISEMIKLSNVQILTWKELAVMNTTEQ